MNNLQSKKIGFWWADNSIELIEIYGEVFALNGWNGEYWNDCFKVGGKYNMDVLEKEKTHGFAPIYNDKFEVINHYMF